MTDLEILEQYANEFCEVLSAYDPWNAYDLIINENYPKFRIFKNGKIAFSIDKGFIKKGVLINEVNGMNIFMDDAPFEKKKEVKCED